MLALIPLAVIQWIMFIGVIVIILAYWYVASHLIFLAVQYVTVKLAPTFAQKHFLHEKVGFFNKKSGSIAVVTFVLFQLTRLL
jgi:hypothetical protein